MPIRLVVLTGLENSSLQLVASGWHGEKVKRGRRKPRISTNRTQFERTLKDMRTNLTKVLGISLLAIVGILAVNVSAAHATLLWQLLKNGANAPNNTLTLIAFLPESELLVPGLGLTINCTGGNVTTFVDGGGTLEVVFIAEFNGCTVLDFPKCKVRSLITSPGSIQTSGWGLGSLGSVANSVEALLASGGIPFTEILIENELCPFNETEAEVAGGLTLLILEALTSLEEHSVHIDDDELFFREQEAFIDGPGGSDTALAHFSDVTGGTWAIHHIE